MKIARARQLSVLLTAVLLVVGSAGPESSGAWITLTSLPRVRAQHGLGAVNGRLYAVGGGRAPCFTPACYATEAAEYDPATDSWIERASTFVRKNHATVAVTDAVYVVGGDDDFVRYTSVEAYQPATDSWILRQSMPTPRTLLGAAAVDGVIYALGGLTGSAGATGASVMVGSNEAYDVATDTWSVKAPMPTARYGVGVAALDGLIYAIGGSTLPSGALLNVVEVYDPATNVWSSRAPLPDIRGSFATVAHGGRLYVIGGFRPGVGTVTSVLIYDPTTDSWAYAPDLNVARASHAAAVLDGVLYATGGMQVSAAGQGLEYFDSVEAAAGLQPLPTQPPPPPPPANHPPFANAGGPYSVESGSSVTLNGSASSDQDAGDSIVQYSWTIDGSLQLSGVAPVVTADQIDALGVGTHDVTLTVSDSSGATGTSSTTLTVRAALVSISVSPASLTLSPGQNHTFQAVGHYSDGSTRNLPSASGGMGPNRPIWSVQFVSSQMDVSACDGSTNPRTSFAGQAFTDVNGQVHETWSPGTPVLNVDGTIDANTVSLSLTCKNGGGAGAILAHWAGTRYQGSYSFAGHSGTVDITGWSQQAPLPEPRFALAAATVDGLVYALGGGNPSLPSTVYAYTPSTNSWAAVTEMPTPREGPGAAALNGRIYVVGGNVSIPGNAVPTASIEAYEPSTNTWITNLQPMPTPRAHLAVVSDGVYVYAIGGDQQPTGGGILNTVERYDPTTNTWMTLPPMPGRGHFIAGGVLNNSIVIVGAGADGGGSDATYVYEIEADRWRLGARMPQAKAAMAAAVANGGLYVVGGSGSSYNTFVYYPPIETPNGTRPEYWSGPASIPTARSELAAAVVGDVIYAIGGLPPGTDPANPLATNEAFSTPPVNTYAAIGGGGDSLPSVQWSSTNTSAATIDGMGNARANAPGVTTIVATASNGMSCLASNSCAALTVADSQPPSLYLPNGVTREAQSASGAIVTYFASAYDTRDGQRPVSCSPPSSSWFPIGTTTVTCSATDSSGNTATGSFNVIVRDTRPPFLSLPSGIMEQADDPSGLTVDYWVSAHDSVDGMRPVSCTPSSGTLFPVGTTTVQCSASDTRGNTAFGSFTVTVTPPPTPAEMVARLLDNTTQFGFEQASELLTSVIERDPAWYSGDTASCGKLGAFINQAQAQRGKKIPADRADVWVAYTMRILTAIGCK